MDPKVRELLNKVKESAVDAGRTAGKVANNLVSQAKMSIRIMEINTSIDVSYKNIGKLLYQVHKGEEVPNEKIDDELMMIDSLNEELSELRAAMEKSKTGVICPQCGSSVGKNDVYCAVCGTRIIREDDCCCEEEDGSCETVNETANMDDSKDTASGDTPDEAPKNDEADKGE